MFAWFFMVPAAAASICMFAGVVKAVPPPDDLLPAPPSCLLQVRTIADSPGIGTTAALDEHGYQEVVAALKEQKPPDGVDMAASAHTDLPDLPDMTDLLVSPLGGRARNMVTSTRPDPPGIGTTAALDEDGYQEVVAALKEEKTASARTDLPGLAWGAEQTPEMAALTQAKRKEEEEEETRADEPGVVATMHDGSGGMARWQRWHGAGTTAALDEHGYEEVVALKDAQQMEIFARRLISKMGLRVISKLWIDQGGLRALIAYHNGESDKQSFKTLQEEIKISSEEHAWVTNQASGASAPLTQIGDGEVATQVSSREMVEFVRRVVSDLGLCVKDEGGLVGVVQWYSGHKGVQTFLDLQGELISASKIEDSWISNSGPCPGSHPSEEALDEMQNATRWATNASVALSSQDNHLSEVEHDEIQNSTRWGVLDSGAPHLSAGKATVPLSSQEKYLSEEELDSLLDDMQNSTRWAKNSIVAEENKTVAGKTVY